LQIERPREAARSTVLRSRIRDRLVTVVSAAFRNGPSRTPAGDITECVAELDEKLNQLLASQIQLMTSATLQNDVFTDELRGPTVTVWGLYLITIAIAVGLVVALVGRQSQNSSLVARSTVLWQEAMASRIEAVQAAVAGDSQDAQSMSRAANEQQDLSAKGLNIGLQDGKHTDSEIVIAASLLGGLISWGVSTYLKDLATRARRGRRVRSRPIPI
jgi:hypothetical protein